MYRTGTFFTGSGNALFGGSQVSAGFNWLTRGKDASFWPYITFTEGSQINIMSADVSISRGITSGSFYGSISDLNRNFFVGDAFSLGGSFGIDDGGKLMIGASKGWGIYKGNVYGSYSSINVSTGLGLGTNIQGNATFTTTPVVIRLDDLLGTLPYPL